MNKIKSSIIEDVFKEGYSLEKIGIKNNAFSKEQAIAFLNILENNKIPVLGGDVFEVLNDDIQINYDNWFCNKLPDENDSDFLKRSVKKSRDYIISYTSSNEILFSFVFDGIEDIV